MTAIQEQAITDKIISNLEQIDGRSKIVILKMTMSFLYDEDDLEDILEEDDDLAAIEKGEREFAAGEGIVMEI